ncbi:MAG: addiction module protein [Nannocystaceae bacterium]
MTREAEELFRAAAALPEAERAALVVRLLDNIAEADVVASHADESRDRFSAAQAGSVESLDDDDAWRLISG